MKQFKIYAFLAIVLLSLQFEAIAQFGLSMTEIKNDQFKIEPDKKQEISDVAIYRESGITDYQMMKGMTNSVVVFWDLKNAKQISQSEEFQGISTMTRFTDDNSKYMIYTFKKGDKSMAVKTIEVQTGKTIMSSPINVGYGIAMNLINDTLMYFCPKFSKSDTVLKIININTGKIERTYPNIGIIDVKLFDRTLVLLYQPNKKIKDFNQENTSNIKLFDVFSGTSMIVLNSIFKDNKSKPELCFLKNDKLFVTYGGMYPKFIEYNKSSGTSVEWKLQEPVDGIIAPYGADVISSDGKYLITQGNISIWDIEKRLLITHFSEDSRVPYKNVHFEGKYLVASIFGFLGVGSDEKDHISYWDFDKLVSKQYPYKY